MHASTHAIGNRGSAAGPPSCVCLLCLPFHHLLQGVREELQGVRDELRKLSSFMPVFMGITSFVTLSAGVAAVVTSFVK
jgi:hypothetical protein